jgi:hypothetical protein
MSNDWFSAFTRLAKGTKARADAVNALFDLVETGMDKMPTEAQMNSGTRNFAADTGSVNAYACALTHVSAPIVDGQHVVLFVAAADVNTSTSVTLNVNVTGNVAVKFPDGNNPAIGDIIGMCEFRYSTTDSAWHFVTTSLARVAAAAASAAAALVSENNAATSETNAAASETNAATSEANAAASAALFGVRTLFNATVYGSTTPGSPTFTETCYYTVLGKVALFEFNISITNLGTMAGALLIGNLPVNIVVNGANRVPITMVGATGLVAGDIALIAPSTATVLTMLYGMPSDTSGPFALDVSLLTATVEIRGSVILPIQ